MRVSWLAALCLFATDAQARTYGVDDMLRLESYGQVVIDPNERWAIVERRGAYEGAARFDYEGYIERATSKLHVLDLAAPYRLNPAFAQEERAGYWSAGFSPSGRRLAVMRLRDNQLDMGVLDIALREVRWLAAPPDLPIGRPTPVWVDDDTLIYVSRTNGNLPAPLGGGNTRPRITDGLRRWSDGDTPTVTIYGSGHFRDAGLATRGSVVVRVDVRSGRSRTLASGVVTDMAPTPDRRILALTLAGDAVQPDPDAPVSLAFRPRRQKLVLLDLSTGEVREPCRECDLLPNLLSWSPSGAELLFYARRPGQTWEQGQLYRLGPSGAVRRATPASIRPVVRLVGGSSITVNASWAGSEPIVRAEASGSSEARWYRVTRAGPVRLGGAAMQPLLATANAVYGIEGGALVKIERRGEARTLMESIVGFGDINLDPASLGSRAYFNPEMDQLSTLVVIDRGNVRAIGIDPRSDRPSWSVPLTSPSALILASAPASGTILYFERDAHGVGTLTIRRPSGDARAVDTIDSHLSDADVPTRIAVQSAGPEGQPLTHWLTLPHGSARAPLAVIVYPGANRGHGPPPSHELARFDPTLGNPLLLVAAGFAVLETSIPTQPASRPSATATTGTGSYTIETIVSSDPTFDPIGRYTRIVLGAVEAAVRHPRVDPERLGLLGRSFGGYGAVAIATRTGRFDAVVAAAGAYDLAATYGRLQPHAAIEESGINLALPFGWFETGQGGLGLPVWRAPELYRIRSPLYGVEQIRTPVMLIHGDLDILPVSEAERLFMALHRLGRDAVFLRYAGEGHSASSPANIRDQWRRIAEFLRERLGAPAD